MRNCSLYLKPLLWYNNGEYKSEGV